MRARLISSPFESYDCAARTDGAAAVVITRRDLTGTGDPCREIDFRMLFENTL